MLATLAFAACRGGHGVQSAPVTPKAAVNAGPDEASSALPPDMDHSLVFPGANVDHVRRPKGAMREVLFSTEAPLDRLIEFYKDGLQKAGYDVTATLRMAARKTWSCDFHKGGQQASIMLFPDDKDKSRMTIDLIYEMPSRTNQGPTEPEETFDVVGPGEVAQKTP
jgi:hypothetical protein